MPIRLEMCLSIRPICNKIVLVILISCALDEPQCLSVNIERLKTTELTKTVPRLEYNTKE